MKNRFTFLMAFCLMAMTAMAQTTSTIATGFNFAYGLTFEGNELFISDQGAGSISKIDITQGTPSVNQVVSGLSSPRDMITIGSDLYVTTAGGVFKIDLMSANPTAILVSQAANTRGLVQVGDYLYYGHLSLNEVCKIDLSAATPTPTTVVSNISKVAGLAVRNNRLFIARESGTINEVDLSSSNPTAQTLVSGLNQPIGLILNGNFLYTSVASGLVSIDITLASPTGTPIQGISFFNPLGLDFKDGIMYVCDESTVKKVEGLAPSFQIAGPICDGQATVTLTGGSPTGGVYSGTGVTDDGNGETFTFDVAGQGLGTYTVTYALNGGESQDGFMVVASPTASFTPPSSVLIDAGAQALTGSPAGGTFTGTGVTGSSFDPMVAGVGTHTITYTYTDGNGCSDMASGEVTVTACVAPVINGLNIIDCPTDPFGFFTLGVDGELNGAATWEIGSASCTEPGTGFSFTTSIQIAFFPPDEPYFVLATGGCVVEPVCFSFVPSELFGISTFSVATTSYCQDAGVQTGLGGGSPTGGTYSGPGVTDDGNGMTYSFDPTAAGIGAHTLTYTVANQWNFDPVTATVEVFGLPAVTFTPPTSVLIDAGAQALTGSPAGGTFTGLGVTGSSFDPMAAGIGMHTITYVYTDVNGCSGMATATITVNPNLPADNACAGANDINSAFGGDFNVPQVTGLWDNTGYTSDGDPTTGFDCWAETSVTNTIWYTFTGDGNTYRIRSVQCSATTYNSDTQVAIYSGSCGSLAPVACNDDEDFNAQVYNISVDVMTQAGETYWMMIDGYEGQQGGFCLEVTNLTPNAITEIGHTNIQIFPNPTTGMVQLTNVNADQVQVFDGMGRLLFSKESPGNSMDISAAPAGMYFMKITEGEKVYSARVVKE